MSDEKVVKVSGVGKRFRLRPGGTRTLKSAVLGWMGGGKSHELWALRDVNFSVARGETLGIIGANGAGKSTLLALLTGTMEPTEGSISVAGSVSSLLELGAGFHPDLTGRENVFLYGAIMGLSRAQMRERFDAIVDFAGLSDFIDQPVKHYSSGMYVRLGFAVAVEVNPEVLLIDEVLAVGDVPFQKKCMDRMTEFRQQGKTMLVVSHDLSVIQKMSDRIMLLDEGRVTGLGDPGDVIGSYRASAGQRAAQSMEKEWGTGQVKITGVEFRDEAGNTVDSFECGGTLSARISYEASQKIDDPVFGFALADSAGNTLYGSNTQLEGVDIAAIEGTGSLMLNLSDLYLAAGSYLFSFSVHSADHKTNYHRLDNAFGIACRTDKNAAGSCCFPCSWDTTGT